MFASNYFAPRYFAPHYFAEVGADPSFTAGGDLGAYFTLQRIMR